MQRLQTTLFTFLLGLSWSVAGASSEVRVIGEMRRMFMAHDIGPNVDVAKLLHEPHIYALGRLTGLKGEVTILDGQVFTSKVSDRQESVALDPAAKSVFLVYSFVPSWRSVPLATNLVSETDVATFLDRLLPANARTAFLVRGVARRARYHIQNYQGNAAGLTHEAHDKAKVHFELSDTPVQLVGFFTKRDEDGGSFVHQGQAIHIHIISDDHKSMGHLESISLAPGARLLLPEAE